MEYYYRPPDGACNLNELNNSPDKPTIMENSHYIWLGGNIDLAT